MSLLQRLMNCLGLGDEDTTRSRTVAESGVMFEFNKEALHFHSRKPSKDGNYVTVWAREEDLVCVKSG